MPAAVSSLNNDCSSFDRTVTNGPLGVQYCAVFYPTTHGRRRLPVTASSRIHNALILSKVRVSILLH